MATHLTMRVFRHGPHHSEGSRLFATIFAFQPILAIFKNKLPMDITAPRMDEEFPGIQNLMLAHRSSPLCRSSAVMARWRTTSPVSKRITVMEFSTWFLIRWQSTSRNS
jgi:hypothetical protein